MDKKITTALCSYGMSGRVFHAPFLALHAGFVLKGAFDRTKKNITNDYPSAISYDSLEDVLNDDSVDLVVVNTPTTTHFDYAQQALTAGKHVVVEKAFTTTVEEAITLKELAEKQGKKISVFQNRRWDSDFRTVQKVVVSGVLGELCEVEIHFDRFNLELSPKTHKEIPSGGAGLLKDLGPHMIDQALCLFGMPEKVFANIRITRKVSLVDDYVDILLYYPFLSVRLKAGYIVKETLPAYILHGTGGSFIKSRADIQEKELLLGKKPNLTNWGTESESEKGLLNSVKDGIFIREMIESEQGNYYEYYDGVFNALTHGLPMPVTADDGIRVMQIIEAAIESNISQKVVVI